MLNHFRLISPVDPRLIERDRNLTTPAVYAMCFDIDGQLTRVGWSSYPRQRIPTLIREQAADVKELWLATIPIDQIFDPKVDYNRENAARRFGRYVQMRLKAYQVRNELYRVPMRCIDDAFGLTISSPNSHPAVETALKAAA